MGQGCPSLVGSAILVLGRGCLPAPQGPSATWRSMSVRPTPAAREPPAWMVKMASDASAHLAPCPRSAFPQAILAPRNPAVMASATMHLEGEVSPQLPDPRSFPTLLPALTASLTRFRCVCEPGWSGPQCSQSLTRDACESRPCQAGGTCTSDGMGFRCTCPPGIQGACLHLPSPGPLPSSLLFPFCFILSSFSAFAPFFFSFHTLTQELGRWVSRWGPCREMGSRNLSRLSHSPCPLQAISVSCCPPAPRIPVSMGATVSLLLASWLSVPAPLVGKVHQLLLLSFTSSATFSILDDAEDPEKEYASPHLGSAFKKKFFFK